MKSYKGKIILTSIITCLPIVVGLLLWNRLPEKMATHFGANNVPDGFSSKAFAVIGLPLILTAIHLFTIIFTLNDPKRKNIGSKMLTFIFWMIPVLSFIVCLSTYAYALGMGIDIGMIVQLFIGALFIVLGNYMSKNRQNYTVGIRLPWTLDSKENWNRTHRMASVLWILTGVIFMINAFFQSQMLELCAIIIMAAAPVIYSFVLHKKGI